MQRLNEKRLIEAIQKAPEAGKVGIILKGVVKSAPKTLHQIVKDDLDVFKLKTDHSAKKNNQMKLTKKDYETMSFKESQSDWSGKDSGNMKDESFRQETPFVYDPFVRSKGVAAQEGGFNQGGSSTAPFAKEKAFEPIKYKFKTKGWDVLQPDPYHISVGGENKQSLRL